MSALESEDTEMIKAYLSGDVYLAFAKKSGMVPETATKESHKFERNLAKSTVLGISYLMTKFGLAIKLSQDTGKTFSEDDAQGLIDAFYETYPVFHSYQTETIPFIYSEAGFIRLNDGWFMFGDNDNFRSVFNVGIQGAGAAIMRKAVDMAVRKGLKVIFTLHDAIYIEYPVGQEHHVQILNDCMSLATADYYKNDSQEIQNYASMIRMDPFAWSDSYKKDSEILLPSGFEIPCSNLYIDERAAKDYESFSKYFEDRAEDSL
ncbi:MAG: DNA polymerase I [bacterium ADurb.BinA186]|nr:MAG: DNA polymerase I [bacterium ADurb.BinA186]